MERAYLKLSRSYLECLNPAFSHTETATGVVLRKACNFIKKSPTQVLSCEYIEIFKSTYLKKQLRKTVSAYSKKRGGGEAS